MKAVKCFDFWFIVNKTREGLGLQPLNWGEARDAYATYQTQIAQEQYEQALAASRRYFIGHSPEGGRSE